GGCGGLLGRGKGNRWDPSDFLLQQKSECHFLNGTQWVQYLDRYFYDRQEFVCFDSDLGKHVAITALGEVYAETMNSDKQIMQYQKARVDRFCRHNYEALNYEPTVTISPTKMDPASPNTILLCTARGFYPLEIEIQWLKNGELEEEGVAFGEELQNGDWTYQLQVMLETQPQWGDIYTCQVGHVSLEAPITVQWGKPLPSARSKLWTGIMGAVIGATFLAVGLFSYLKSKKDESGGLEEKLWGGDHLGEDSHRAQQVAKRVSLRNSLGTSVGQGGYKGRSSNLLWAISG
uniref:Ig-like domain-containing protein n=1 Tax=Pseudonaja textilis TaxID=8673 RepID=A0A670ZTI5_PSETE